MIKNKSRNIAVNGILIALLIVMTLTMLFSGVAVLPLAVIVVGAAVIGGWTAFILGFTFGLVSLIAAYIIPSATAPFFQNPLISLLPRILSAVLGFGVFKLSEFVIGKINTKKKKPLKEYTSKSISTILGSIFVVFFNTLFVLSMMWILYNGRTIGDNFVNKEFVMGLVSINFAIEVCVTPIVATPVTFAVDKFLKRNQKQVVTDADLSAIDNVDYLNADNINNVVNDSEKSNFDNNYLENQNLNEVQYSDCQTNNDTLLNNENTNNDITKMKDINENVSKTESENSN